MNVGEHLKGKQICICAGSGGVGKTTASAAIALGMAAEGKKVAVITIDPAKRLANALGLDQLGNEPKLVDPKRFQGDGLEMKGELWAMMLDSKRTWDELIVRYAPDKATQKNILENRIYQQVSNALVGSQEYMAMEKLYELYHEGDYDLLVLDTPPSRNALDFLDAPERLSKFIEGKSLQFFLRPGRAGMKFFGRGTGMLFAVLKRITGVDLLTDLSDFFTSFGDMAGGFNERAREVSKLMADRRTTFMLVSAPEREPIEEAIYFKQRMRDANLPFGAVIINRLHFDYLNHTGNNSVEADAELVPKLEEAFGTGDSGVKLAGKVLASFNDYQVLADRDSQNIKRLLKAVGRVNLIRVPQFDIDIHDVEGLMLVNSFLFSTNEEREATLASAAH